MNKVDLEILENAEKYRMKKWESKRVALALQTCSDEYMERWKENYQKLSQRDVKIVGMYK